VASSQSGILTIDIQGKVTAVNDTAIQLMGLPPGGGAGDTCESLLADHEQLLQTVRDTLSGQIAGGYREFVSDDEEPSASVLGATLTLILNRHQREVGLLLVINDMTELYRLRREVEEGRRLASLGEMAGGLAHQVRNSLGAISGYGVLLKKHLIKADLPESHAEELLNECKEAEDLIARFLSFARPLEYLPILTDLAEVVNGAIDQVNLAGYPSSVVVRAESLSPVETSADPLLLKQAIVNLVDNGIQACEGGGGTVEISVWAEEDAAIIQIEDTGSGISEDDLNRIFTPFYSSRPSGTGLGLPVVRKIIDAHSGRIEVRSRLGQGTRLTILLPLHSPVDKSVKTPKIDART
jgi:signal transduction histidine kinase